MGQFFLLTIRSQFLDKLVAPEIANKPSPTWPFLEDQEGTFRDATRSQHFYRTTYLNLLKLISVTDQTKSTS